NLSAPAISGTNFNRGQSRQHIQGVEGKAGDAADPSGMADHHAVKPADAAGTSGGGSVFASPLPNVIADRILHLGGEGAVAHPGGVGLGHSDHLVNFRRPHTAADADPSG